MATPEVEEFARHDFPLAVADGTINKLDAVWIITQMGETKPPKLEQLVAELVLAQPSTQDVFVKGVIHCGTHRWRHWLSSPKDCYISKRGAIDAYRRLCEQRLAYYQSIVDQISAAKTIVDAMATTAEPDLRKET